MGRKIIIVDKDNLYRELLDQIFKNEYETILVDDGKTALVEISKNMNDLAAIILDWDVPVFNGNQVMQVLRAKNIMDHIPVILTTELENKQVEVSGFSLQAAAVLHKPYAALAVRKQVINLIELYSRLNTLEKSVVEKEQNAKLWQDRIRGYYDKLLDAISLIVEYKSPKSERHVYRMKGMTRILAAAYKNLYPEAGLTEDIIEMYVRAAAVYDIGKIGVSDTILLKPGKLTEDERQIMMSHTTKGAEVIELIKDMQDAEQFRISYEVCRWHHERHDGNGYPDGLKEDEIPISAQIVSLVDVYDALVSERTYKKAYDYDTAYKMIVNNECGVFSPRILKCLEVSKRLLELFADSNA